MTTTVHLWPLNNQKQSSTIKGSKMKHLKIRLSTSLIAIAFLVATPSFTQEAFDEIIVTAKK